jgi:hypothetical protein
LVANPVMPKKSEDKTDDTAEFGSVPTEFNAGQCRHKNGKRGAEQSQGGATSRKQSPSTEMARGAHNVEGIPVRRKLHLHGNQPREGR